MENETVDFVERFETGEPEANNPISKPAF